MPSPVAHVLGGLAIAFVVDALARRHAITVPILVGCAVMAVAPDFDLLGRTHRTYTHSIGAVALVAVICLFGARARATSVGIAAVLTAAYASHLPLDWLSKDTRDPSGLTVLWPFSTAYYQAGWDVFPEISRRYWLLDEFIFNNVKAAMWEVAVMAPVLLTAWVVWSHRTLKHEAEERKTAKAGVTR